jgi:phosphoenolpyruvate-protein kinase (PTS system EI component)
MGLKRFSIMPRNIPVIKEMVSKLSYAELAESVFHMESLESTEEVALWLKNINKRMLGDVFEKLFITAEV